MHTEKLFARNKLIQPSNFVVLLHVQKHSLNRLALSLKNVWVETKVMPQKEKPILGKGQQTLSILKSPRKKVLPGSSLVSLLQIDLDLQPEIRQDL